MARKQTPGTTEIKAGSDNSANPATLLNIPGTPATDQKEDPNMTNNTPAPGETPNEDNKPVEGSGNDTGEGAGGGEVENHIPAPGDDAGGGGEENNDGFDKEPIASPEMIAACQLFSDSTDDKYVETIRTVAGLAEKLVQANGGPVTLLNTTAFIAFIGLKADEFAKLFKSIDTRKGEIDEMNKKKAEQEDKKNKAIVAHIKWRRDTEDRLYAEEVPPQEIVKMTSFDAYLATPEGSAYKDLFEEEKAPTAPAPASTATAESTSDGPDKKDLVWFKKGDISFAGIDKKVYLLKGGVEFICNNGKGQTEKPADYKHLKALFIAETKEHFKKNSNFRAEWLEKDNPNNPNKAA